jgi:hypothetical protein
MFTRTVTDATRELPPLFDATIVNVVVEVTLGTTSVVEDVVANGSCPGVPQLNVVGAPPPVQAAVSVTLPPPTGNERGDETTVHPLGGAGRLTGTVTDAAGAAPLPLAAITVNVDVVVTLGRTSDGAEVEVETPGPLHANVVGVPPEHVVLSVTLPPPIGSDGGDDVTVQPLGGGTSIPTL